MTLFEQLKAKKAELKSLETAIKDGDAEAIAKGQELVDAIESLETAIENAEKAQDILKKIGPDAEKEEDVKEDGMKSLFAQAKSVDKKVKGWSIGAEFKASTDTMTSVQITDYDKQVPAHTIKGKIADLFSGATVSGNAITYFTEDEFEGTSPAKVAENAKKAQGSTGYTSHTVALSKIAGYVKETDEVLEDNDFLASAVKDCMVYRLAKAEDKEIVTTILAASGTQSATYTDGGNTGDADTLVDGILYAKSLIDSATPYEATCVIMNPADFFALQTAKDDNGQYLGGGFFLGAYGNGEYKNAYNPWGLKVMTDSNVTSGTVIIAAEEAVKVYRKGTASVKVYEQNEDDALYNRVTVLAEERIAPVVKVPAGVVILEAATA